MRKTANQGSAGAAACESDEVISISRPTNVKHEWHVGFDNETGQIQGLPPVWEAWLKQSDIRSG